MLIFVILYIIYLILSYKYKEYNINSRIEELDTLKTQIEASILQAEWIIEYKTTKAYKNKILKEQEGLKNRWEQVVYLTTEEKYNKFTKKTELNTGKKKNFEDTISEEQKTIQNMSIYQRWEYYLFQKSN